MKSRKAYIPAGHLGTKRMGELAEIGFMYRAATYGIGVAKPWATVFLTTSSLSMANACCASR